MLKLQAADLRKSYRGRKVVNDINLEIRQGEVVGLLGPNGAGKTTTFYILVGLARPDYGRVMLDGEDITDLPMYLRARNGISYLPQEPSVFRKLTVEENLMTVLETLSVTPEQRRDRVEELLAQMGLEGVRYSQAHVLSGGERRRLEIARSLVLSPSFILLDEPFAGIDPLTVVDIQKIVTDLSASGIGVLVTDHNVRDTLAVTHRAYIISEGKILAAGTPAQLSADPEVRRIYLGEGFKLNSCYELSRTQIASPAGAEADFDAGPRADGQRARAEPPGAAGDDQSGDHGQSGARRASGRQRRRGRQLYRRGVLEEGGRAGSRYSGGQSLRRIRFRLVFLAISRHRRRTRRRRRA